MENSNSSNGYKILIATDAWDQTNGVVTTLNNLKQQLIKLGHTVSILSHKHAKHSRPMPFYPEVTLAWLTDKVIADAVYSADAVHIATPEGPVGFKTMRFCDANAIPYTTGYHTKWPEFIRARFPIPIKWTYPLFKWLHKNSQAVLVPTNTVKIELQQRGFVQVQIWTRGVDRELFSPIHKHPLSHVGHPFMLCVSRISKEKNLEAFCELDWPQRHTKVIVGDGPYRTQLQEQYPEVIFAGEKHGLELAQFYACADVFVFPSKADTFGLVMIEAMASGTPVAAFPVTGPIDVIDQGITVYMHQDLGVAVQNALMLDSEIVHNTSKKWTWEKCAEQFMNYLHLKH